MNILKIIWDFINSKIFGYILIGVAIIFLINTCNKNSALKHEAEIKDQNIAALNDSVKNTVLQNGELEASINGYMADAKDLAQYNSKLAKQVKQEEGKVITLNNIVVDLRQNIDDLNQYIDSLKTEYSDPVKVNDSTYRIHWKLPYIYDKDNYDIYSGYTQVKVSGIQDDSNFSMYQDKTILVDRNSRLTLTWGQKFEDGRIKVFARTSHPAFKAKLLEGTYVDFNKKKHWFTGFGIGPSINMGYDFMHNQPAMNFGVSIHYNIYEW